MEYSNRLWKWLALVCFFSFAFYISNEPERMATREAKRARIAPPKGESYKVIRGYNYTTGEYNFYNEDEVRALRDDNPGYIIKTTGTPIRSKKTQLDRDIEEWMDDNQEYYEMYKD